MTKKNYLTKLIIAICLVLAILVVGTVFDLAISKAICVLPAGSYYTQNFFTAFLEIFGEDILYVMLVSALAIIFNYFYKKQTNRKKARIVILVACVILELGVIFYCFYKILKNAYNYTSPAFKTFFSYFQTIICLALLIALVAFLVNFAFSKLSPETLARLVKWAFIVLIVAALSNGIVQGLKLVMHRTRFRTMLFVGDTEFSYYTNWFVINKNTFSSTLPMASDFFKSFPSGHTCAATSIFLLCLLPNFSEKLNTKGWKIGLIVASIAYILMLGSSRIICGAHFFTDVFFSFSVTLSIMFLVNLLYKKVWYKHFDKVEEF